MRLIERTRAGTRMSCRSLRSKKPTLRGFSIHDDSEYEERLQWRVHDDAGLR